MEAKRKTRRHLSAQAWTEVFARFEASGEAVTGFCKREGLHTSSFQRWRRRLSAIPTMQGHEPGEERRQVPVASFIEMGPMPAASAAAGRLDVRLELGGGVVLHLVRC
jgi:hypothetical protein